MKRGMLCVLVCFLLSVLSPPAVIHGPSDADTSLVTLDVCHAAGSAIFGDDDTVPVIDECPCHIYNPGFAGFCDAIDCASGICILGARLERPPEI